MQYNPFKRFLNYPAKFTQRKNSPHRESPQHCRSSAGLPAHSTQRPKTPTPECKNCHATLPAALPERRRRACCLCRNCPCHHRSGHRCYDRTLRSFKRRQQRTELRRCRLLQLVRGRLQQRRLQSGLLQSRVQRRRTGRLRARRAGRNALVSTVRLLSIIW